MVMLLEQPEDIIEPKTAEEQEEEQRGTAIPFDYSQATATATTTTTTTSFEAEPNYSLPSALLPLPEGMETPSNSKQLSIIERTAKFLSTEDAQTEIVVKAKQAQNPLFSFLNIDDKLYPFYRHLRVLIEEGKYKVEKPPPPAPVVLPITQ